MAELNRCYEGVYLTVVTLRIDLIVGKCGSKGVTSIKLFDGFVMLVDFLKWDTKEGGGFWLEGQQLHLREAVNSFRRTDFEGFLGRCPAVEGG